MPPWAQELLPIVGLIVIIVLVLRKLPRIDVGHTPAFRTRRFLTWFPSGLTYAFLYMGRYNVNVYTSSLGLKEQFATVFSIGTAVYGFSFLLNGPLTDRFGGRKTMMVAAVGAAMSNVAMGILVMKSGASNLALFSVLYGVNMYFQSFGAVSIVKVNASWFHLRERGMIGGVFGILISLGIYFAYDWGKLIVRAAQASDAAHPPYDWVFFVPAVILVTLAVVDFFLVRDTPGEAGHRDFDTEDASSGDDGERLGVVAVGKKMLSNPAIVTIALVEFCSGYLRNAIMQWYPFFANKTDPKSFVLAHWGMLLCVAGIMGGMFAGVISDHVFASRRGPVSAVLYALFLTGALLMFITLGSPALGWVAVFMSLCIIGVHGMLSGTASMDFGGRKNTGIAVGIIDGFVYLGASIGTVALGRALPTGDAMKVAANWWTWPLVMLPPVVIGLVLAARLWNARPTPRAAAAH